MEAGYSTREVAKLLKLSEHRIRSYVRAGLVGRRDSEKTPTRTPWRFDFRDLLVLRMAGRLLESGLPPARVQRALIALRRQLANQAPLSVAQLYSEDGKVVASDGSILWDAESGQCLLRFGADRLPEAIPLPMGKVAQHPPMPHIEASQLHDQASQESADHWFDAALELEEEEPQKAYELYLRALAADPEHVESTINVGRLCSANGELRRAAAYFRQAVRVDPAHPVAHFNLAVTLHDLGDLPGATAAYRAALAHDPQFADAHYNLATLLEQQGERDQAMQHFTAYRKVVRDLNNNPPA